MANREAPAPFTIAGARSGTPSSSTPSATQPTAPIDGTWQVGPGSLVGYRVKADLVGGLLDQTAVGRTDDVSGQLTITGQVVTSAKLTADLRTLQSDSSKRDGQVQTRILETARFPTATFELTSPIALPLRADVGVVTTQRATGNLTIHGVTRQVTFELEGAAAAHRTAGHGPTADAVVGLGDRVADLGIGSYRERRRASQAVVGADPPTRPTLVACTASARNAGTKQVWRG